MDKPWFRDAATAVRVPFRFDRKVAERALGAVGRETKMRLQWFARGGDIEKQGPYPDPVEAANSLRLASNPQRFPPNAFIWPEVAKGNREDRDGYARDVRTHINVSDHETTYEVSFKNLARWADDYSRPRRGGPIDPEARILVTVRDKDRR